MKVRMSRNVTVTKVMRACAFIACVLLLASCAVDKAALAARVDLHDVDLRSVPDGVYEASYTIQPPAPIMAANKSVRVRVTVAGGKYAQIEILQPPRLAESGTYKALVSRVRESQSLSPDAVSSATVTSFAVLKAVQIAVSSAGK
jgi:uncharacterized protein with FMN-binding domain